MSRARRLLHRAARGAARSLSPDLRELALALGARAAAGPAVLPGPPEGPVLVVAPHPDDETIGCGGALARHARRGDAVTVLVATSGEATRGGSGDVAAAREAECRAACADLGIGEPVFLRLPDGALAGHAGELAEAVARHGAGARTVYLPSLLDPHADHRAANAAVAAAGLDADTYGYEVWAAAPVDALLDVTAVWARKETALRRYATALESVDYVRVCAGLAAYRSGAGGLDGAGMAEGFLRLAAEEHRRLAAGVGLARGLGGASEEDG
ncbi:MAG TPA: PIG-L family deacetylase [Egibacteraceae bacterium]|nr:PIG-L family deacetylase [Egibacteraceae bacterium]